MSQDESDLRLEIGHVLFIDIVGYSKLLIDEQRARLRELSDVVLAARQVRDAKNEQLVRLPTGDGMALVFRNSSEEPVQCALEVAQALILQPQIKVRMGVHSGPVSEVTDLNGHANLAGAGINIAQRVMDCGDAGHILLSQRVAGDLEQYRQWQSALHDLGECEVKHGIRLHLFNLYNGEVGNPAIPQKLQQGESVSRIPPNAADPKRWAIFAVAAVLVLALAAAALLFLRKKPLAALVTAPADKSVAVVPLVNTSGDPNNEYFSDGLSEELIAVLAKIPGLRVIGRGSSFLFKGKTSDSASIGQKLGVAQLIEGSVRKQEDRVRIVASLIKASDGEELWSETYDRNVKDVFAVQSEIAQAVAGQLKVKLFGEKPVAGSASSTQNPAAHDAALQSAFYFNQGNEAAAKQAIHYAEEATRLDPNYAAGWAALARAWRLWAATFETVDSIAAASKSRVAADKAIALDPTSPEGLVAQSAAALYPNFDYRGAENYARRALEVAPGDASAMRSLGSSLIAQGRLSDADSVLQKVYALDPLPFGTWYNPGLIAMSRGKYAEAKQKFQKVLESQPKAARIQAALTVIDILQNNPNGALEHAQLEQEGFWRDYAMALALQVGNDRAAAEGALRNMIQKYAKVGAFQIASVYGLRRQPDEVFAWLDTAYANRDGGLAQLMVSPFILNCRDDPRFAAFSAKLGIQNVSKDG